jgi:hypothetical protein
MVTPQQKRLATAAVAAFALVLLWQFWPASRPAPRGASQSRASAPKSSTSGATRRGRTVELAPIGLARLDERQSGVKAGRRDIFDFGPPPTVAPPPTMAPPPVAVENAPPPPPLPTGPPPPPPLNVKYIGAMEDKQRGLKVAILLTDRQEILTGRSGDVVGNRLKIVSIGLESVDVQDVGASNVRRIPLKGN